jgi:hypothetical protein
MFRICPTSLLRLPEQTVTPSTDGALYRIGAYDQQRDGASTWLSVFVDADDRFGLGDGLRTRWDRWSRCSLRGSRRCGQRSETTQGEPSASRPSSGMAGESTRSSRPTFTASEGIRDPQRVEALDGWASSSSWEDSSRKWPTRGSRSGPRRTSWTSWATSRRVVLVRLQLLAVACVSTTPTARRLRGFHR